MTEITNEMLERIVKSDNEVWLGLIGMHDLATALLQSRQDNAALQKQLAEAEENAERYDNFVVHEPMCVMGIEELWCSCGLQDIRNQHLARVKPQEAE